MKKNFKDFLLESVIEESNDFGIEAKKNKFVISKGVVYKIKDCSETSATLVNGGQTKTVALKNGRFPNTFEFSLAGEVANESKNKSKGKVVTEAVNSVSFDLSFSSSNASMVDDPEGEVSTILRNVAKKISNGSTHGAVMDSDGNKIGKFSYDIDEDDDSVEFEADDDQGIYDEKKCAKGCTKCGAKMKADEDGRCPECGAKMLTEASGKIGGQSLYFDDDNQRKKAQRLESAYVKEHPDAPFKEVKAFITFGVKEDKPYKQLIDTFKAKWNERVG